VSDFAPHLEAAFDLDHADGEVGVAGTDGAVPPHVRGTYYLNGPARFARNGTRYRHWLDGDGRVCAVRFGRDRVTAAARFVRTAKSAAEDEAGEAVFRAFGTACGPNRLRRGLATESPANVSVHPYRDTLLAFGEQSLPYELDPATLETRGAYDFDGQLTELSPFSAHPRTDPDTGELFNFGVAFSPSDPRLHIYRFDPGGRLVYRRLVRLPYPCAVHDFALSRRFAAFHLSPYLLDLAGLMRGGRPTMDCLSWQPERGSYLLVVDRATGEPATMAPAGRGYCLHLINAFDDGERLTVDLIEYARPVYDQYQVLPVLYADVSPGRPVRLGIDLARPGPVERREWPCDRSPDFPVVAASDVSKPYRDFWMLAISAAGRPGRKFFDTLVHGDWSGGADVFRAPPGSYFAGEPAFVPVAGRSRAGSLICPMFDAAAAATSVAVFDAFAVSAGPVAAVRLDRPFHLGFHAAFVPAGGGSEP
jgi:all-trans-8'-apo-beta-carotenal 15,15'-oxygenase